MLKLLNMLMELLATTGLTFEELSRLVAQLRSVGRPCGQQDREAFRTWLRALIGAFRCVVADTETGRDTALMTLASSLTEERWPTAQQMFDVLLADTAPHPDDAQVLPLAVLLAEGSGVEAARVSMLCYALSRVVRLVRT
jgi:hypothetical protein